MTRSFHAFVKGYEFLQYEIFFHFQEPLKESESLFRILVILALILFQIL